MNTNSDSQDINYEDHMFSTANFSQMRDLLAMKEFLAEMTLQDLSSILLAQVYGFILFTEKIQKFRPKTLKNACSRG